MLRGMKIILLSRCLKLKLDFYLFHFQGFYRGVKINSVLINAQNIKFQIGEDYILEVEVEKVEETGELVGRCLRSRQLFSV